MFTGCAKHPPASSAAAALPEASVRVQTVRRAPLPAAEEVVGTVQAKLHATIEAKISGRIQALSVTLGQSVKQGDLLAQLDVREIQAKLDQASAGEEQAKRDFDRIAALVKQQAVTPSEFDAAQARYRVARAAVAEAKSMLAYSRIEAPFDGVITRKLADAGDLAVPGKPLLEMEDPSALQFIADVPEAISDRIRLGATLPVRIGPGDRTLQGRVAEIAPAVDPRSRSLQVKLDLPPTPGLRSGQFGRLEAPLAPAPTIDIPASALVRRGQMEMVFVAKDGHAQLRLVKIGKRWDAKIELLSGVSPGEMVVVEGADQLADGQPLEIQH